MVIGAAAPTGATGYLIFLLLAILVNVSGGKGGISIGDFLGFAVWSMQGAIGGLIAAGVHRSRIRAADTSGLY
jgi:hypothetical protein